MAGRAWLVIGIAVITLGIFLAVFLPSYPSRGDKDEFSDCA